MTTVARIALAVGFAAFVSFGAQAGELPNAEFDKMKTLVGEWDGTSNLPKEAFKGKAPTKPLSIFKLIASDSALMETLRFGPVEMVTIYHPLGEHMMLTHYCAARNQPRMRTVSVPPGMRQMRYEFMDATNMMNSDATAMHDLVIYFKDADHMVEEWHNADPKMPPTLLTFTRKKH